MAGIYKLDIKPQELKNYWLTADTHFNHDNIIKLCNRPFKSIEEMNELLLDTFSVVKRFNYVIHLGDLAFIKYQDYHLTGTKYWLKSVHKSIQLIKGNHDKFGYDFGIIRTCGMKLFLTHVPYFNPIFNNRYSIQDIDIKPDWTIHGHTHNNDLVNYPFINKANKTINVGIEVSGYKMVNLGELLEQINN